MSPKLIYTLNGLLFNFSKVLKLWKSSRLQYNFFFNEPLCKNKGVKAGKNGRVCHRKMKNTALGSRI
jgi:hypothetical protein